MLDLAGPLQTFHDANACGADFELSLTATAARVDTAQLLSVAALPSLLRNVNSRDLIMVPGRDLNAGPAPTALTRWLRGAVDANAHVCGICTGAFVLGEAGLLDRRTCTTHWKRLDELRRRFPSARPAKDRLFVTDGSITTSAGVASGIDVALWFVERQYGPLLTSRVAREMVVYVRRDGHHKQDSVYLDYRTHVNSAIHTVQDYLIANPASSLHIRDLARMARMSPRTLTRQFLAATGLTIVAFRTKVRLESAQSLLGNPNLTLDAVASMCGFNDPRHFRREWRRHFGSPASQSRLAHRAGKPA